jgi:pimeloyl-ACP methyl ester carboxylesterase
MMTTDFKRINIVIKPHGLAGILYHPRQPRRLIIFAHGSGSSRFSPRNAFIAEKLVDRGFACLLFDLLAPGEAEDRRNVFDIPLLGARVRDAGAWASSTSEVRDLPIGLFRASTGAAAALVAAADEPTRVAAIVSRGGRPDLAGESLARVLAPTLLIVGGFDCDVLELNRQALRACDAKRVSTLCRAPPIFSRSPGRWKMSLRTPATGSSNIFRRASSEAELCSERQSTP